MLNGRRISAEMIESEPRTDLVARDRHSQPRRTDGRCSHALRDLRKANADGFCGFYRLT